MRARTRRVVPFALSTRLLVAALLAAYAMALCVSRAAPLAAPRAAPLRSARCRAAPRRASHLCRANLFDKFKEIIPSVSLPGRAQNTRCRGAHTCHAL